MRYIERCWLGGLAALFSFCVLAVDASAQTEKDDLDGVEEAKEFFGINDPRPIQPVDYVDCTPGGGDRFFWIPGTEACLKINGGRPKVTLYGGIPNKPGMVFDGFGQEILTDTGWAGGVAFSAPFGYTSNGWVLYLQGDYAHIEMDQDGHRNIVGGATGPSSGLVRLDYFGAGLLIERALNERFSIGFGLGGGGLHQNVSGSFRANGTVPALKVDAQALVRISDYLTAGPFASAIVPFGNVSGGAGKANSQFEVDPLFVFGLKMNISLTPAK